MSREPGITRVVITDGDEERSIRLRAGEGEPQKVRVEFADGTVTEVNAGRAVRVGPDGSADDGGEARAGPCQPSCGGWGAASADCVRGGQPGDGNTQVNQF